MTQQSSLQNTDNNVGSNPFAPPTQTLPPDVTQNAQAAQQAVQVEETSEQLLGGLAGIIGLGVIFVFTQVYSMSLGIKYGHLDRARVKSAYKNGTMGYSSYEDYQRHVLEPRVRRTERRLQQLKNGLYHDSQVPPSTISFAHWLNLKTQMELERAHGAAPRRVAASPGFDAQAVAAEVMAIADPAQRRAWLRQVVAGLTPPQSAQLQREIQSIKDRQVQETSWIDEI